MSREMSLAALQEAVARIDEVLVPWGFQFQVANIGHSSPGGYANGFYARGSTRIGLIYRASLGLGCVVYEQDESVEDRYSCKRITYSIEHLSYMRHLGYGDDCWLIASRDGLSSVSRMGGDPVLAFIHDLQQFAAPTLHQECPEFDALIRTGYVRKDWEMK